VGQLHPRSLVKSGNVTACQYVVVGVLVM